MYGEAPHAAMSSVLGASQVSKPVPCAFTVNLATRAGVIVPVYGVRFCRATPVVAEVPAAACVTTGAGTPAPARIPVTSDRSAAP